MSIFTLMAFMVPTGLQAETTRPFNFFNSSGAIQPDFLAYWGNAYRPVLYTFGSIHLILSIWMVLEYFIINWPNFRLPSLYYNLVARYGLVCHCTTLYFKYCNVHHRRHTLRNFAALTKISMCMHVGVARESPLRRRILMYPCLACRQFMLW